MARRNGRPGDYLMSDEYYGFTRYASQLKRDFWGAWAQKPLERNLQEIATPLDDPQPVAYFNGPTYEYTTACSAELAPIFVGNTNVPTNRNGVGVIALNLFPGIGAASVGCTLRVY